MQAGARLHDVLWMCLDLVGLNVTLQDTDSLLPKSENDIRIYPNPAHWKRLPLLRSAYVTILVRTIPDKNVQAGQWTGRSATAVIGSQTQSSQSRHHVHLL